MQGEETEWQFHLLAWWLQCILFWVAVHGAKGLSCCVMFLKGPVAIPVTHALLSTLKLGMPPREGGGTQPRPLPSMGCRPSWSPSQSGANSSVVAAALLGGHGAPGLQALWGGWRWFHSFESRQSEVGRRDLFMFCGILRKAVQKGSRLKAKN